MRKASPSAHLVTNPTNIYYLSGFSGVNPEEREAYLLHTEKSRYLFTHAMYLNQARSAALKTNTEIVELRHDRPLIAGLRHILETEKISSLGFDEANLTVAEYAGLKNALDGVRLIGEHGRVEKLREIKTEEERAHIQHAAAVTDAGFAYIRRRIRPGVTEAKLAWELEGFLRYKAGAIAFAPIVAFNEHSALPHYNERGNLPLRSGSLILLDFGARVNGYCADMTRVVFLGTPNDDWVKAYQATLDANRKALSLLVDGERNGATLDAAAKEVLAEAGFPPYPHSLGHAVGLDIHESPRLSTTKEAQLKPGMAITIEPGIYIPNEFGIRIEDLVFLSPKKVDVLSKSPTDLLVI